MELGRDVWTIIIRKCPDNELRLVNRFLYQLSWDPEVIKTQVDYFTDHLRKLPYWLRSASKRPIQLPLKEADQILESTGRSTSILLAGGFVTKILYTESKFKKSQIKPWVSDLDIWGTFDYSRAKKRYFGSRKDITYVDRIHQHDAFESVIANFDLSCSQIGMILPSREVITTRLFWYTYYTGKIIAMPLNRMVDYRTRSPDQKNKVTYRKDLEALYIKLKLHGMDTSLGVKKCQELLARTHNRIEKYRGRGVGDRSIYIFVDKRIERAKLAAIYDRESETNSS